MLRNTQREEIRAQMAQALKDNDSEAYAAAFDQMLEQMKVEMKEDVARQIEESRTEQDNRILAGRGVRQLTSAERDYYNSFLEAARSSRPRQAIENLDKALPITVVQAVFEDLRQNHPLLSVIDFTYVPYGMKVLLNGSDTPMATWGDLCDPITEELTAGFDVIDATQQKLSAYIQVCASGLEVGPEWIDRYVREYLAEAFSNGLELAIISGTGKKQPIGMDRDLEAAIVDGEYAQKTATPITKLDLATLGSAIGTLAAGHSIIDPILVVNSGDYYSKVAPWVLQRINGSFVEALPFGIKVIPSQFVEPDSAIIGLAHRYFAAIGIANNGRIEYSDEFAFLDDVRTYKIKGYANGMPKDNGSFGLLDISGLEAPAIDVHVVNTEDDPVNTKEAE